jgi:predicted RNA-binding protein with PIN domain
VAATSRLIVDGMNVVGSRPDGWWRDRRGAMRRLVEALEGYAASEGRDVVVVLDGAPFDVGTPLHVDVRFASRRGPNAADDDIAAIARAGDTVVTSDADLERRVRESGVDVLGAGAFRRSLDD